MQGVRQVGMVALTDKPIDDGTVSEADSWYFAPEGLELGQWVVGPGVRVMSKVGSVPDVGGGSKNVFVIPSPGRTSRAFN